MISGLRRATDNPTQMGAVHFTPSFTVSNDQAACVLYSGTDNTCKAYAEQLAADLSLSLVDTPKNPFKLHLVYTGYRLELQYNPSLIQQKHHPVSVDFLHGKSIHRRISTFTIANPLAKAAGVKPKYRPNVIDATAGFGMDGICLAWIGCQVLLVERNPIVHALLQDGLKRARRNKALAQIIDDRITLQRGDAIELFQERSFSCESILLDPMYPEDSKRALNRKEMRIVRQLVGVDPDHHELFDNALGNCSKRIAVKRPKGAPPISPHRTPSFTIAMKSGRFDIYMLDHL